MADQQFCLRWNNHQSTLISVFDTLLENGTLVDCTLAAEGQYLKAHKVVLCACSPYLETLLSQHYEKHPIVILKDVKFSELKSMMDYMYRGEVNISQDQLGTFLKAAESLQIKGLSDNGADGDARDVGSTSKVPQRKPSQSVTTTRSSDAAPESPAHRSRDGSISPTSRKRRRIRRNSQGDDSNVGDSHLDTSNSCDLPSQAQSIPIVPNIPATVTSSITTTPIIKTPIIKPEQTEIVNRIDPSNMNSLPPESGLLKEKIEPSEPLLEPKTEYLEDVNTEDSVEDLTLDDDDEMDGMDISNMSNMSNMSRPGPSHGNDLSSISNQGFAPWQLGGNQSGTDEVFMAAQEAVSAHRDSQVLESSKDSANKLASPSNSSTASSPEGFAGFHQHEMKNKKIYILNSYNKQAIRVSQPRTSKSRASLVWQKKGRKLTDSVKEEPNENSANTKKNQTCVMKKDAGNTGRMLKSKKLPIKENQSNNMKITRITEKNPTVKITKLPIKQIQSDNITEIVGQIPTSSSMTQENKNKNLQAIKNNIKRKRKHSDHLNGFKCNQCGKKYRYLRGLNQHRRLECNKGPQFPCPYCPSKYRYRQNIREHVRSCHELAFPRWYATHYVVPHIKKQTV